MSSQSDATKNAAAAAPQTLNVICGDPLEHRACFTRFILPFAWKPDRCVPCASAPADQHFRPATATDWIHPANEGNSNKEPFFDFDRRKYLTAEVDELLFKRARWFVLEPKEKKGGNHWKTLNIKSGLDNAQHTYQVAIRPPALVLFERGTDDSFTERHCRKQEREPEGDVLRTGFLIIEVFFPKLNDKEKKKADGFSAPTYADVLRFNEIFRYWRCPYEKHPDEKERPEVFSIYNEWFAPEIWQGKDIADLYARRWLKLLQHPVRDQTKGESIQYHLMPNNWFSTDKENPFPKWLVNPDDRAFTMACMVVDKLDKSSAADAPKGSENGSEMITATTIARGLLVSPGATVPPQAGFWVQLMNVDRPRKPANVAECSAFQWEWAKDRTYLRWAHSGTLYGFTSHSFAMLAPVARDDKGNLCHEHHDSAMGLHFGQMYFDTTLLLLYLRVSLFRFSKRLHEISCDAREKEDSREKEFEEWQPKFDKIRWDFLIFENLYQFPLLSNQQQHIEMYAKQREHFDIKELYDEVDDEIRSSDEHVNNMLDARRNKLATILNVVAFVGLAAALSLGWLDAHSDKDSAFFTEGWDGFLRFVGIFIACLWVFLFLSKYLSGVMLWSHQAISKLSRRIENWFRSSKNK